MKINAFLKLFLIKNIRFISLTFNKIIKLIKYCKKITNPKILILIKNEVKKETSQQN